MRTAAEVEAARANHKAVWRALLDANTGAHLETTTDTGARRRAGKRTPLRTLDRLTQNHTCAGWMLARLRVSTCM